MAYIPRVFLSNDPFPGDLTSVAALPLTVDITDRTVTHHLHTVMRLRAGDPVDVVVEERCFKASILTLSAKRVSLNVLEKIPLPADSLPAITLAAALIPDERWRWMLQKTTELGVRRIAPLLTDYGKIKVADAVAKQERWQAVVTSAACQSEGLFIPEVLIPQTTEEWLKTVSIAGRNILLFERANGRQPLVRWLQDAEKDPSSGITLVVGPEGGWSPQEVGLFTDHGFKLAALGQRILRSETAAIAAMSAVAAVYTKPD